MMPSKKKKYNARFPPGRIKKIMQTDEDVGKVAQAVPVIISRALELFVESLLTKTMEITSAKNAKTLSPSHMKHCIFSESRFDFLKDLVKSLPDMAGDGEECLATLPPGRPALMENEPPSYVVPEVYSAQEQISQEVPSSFQVGECFKTYAKNTVSNPSMTNNPNYESDSVNLNNYSESVADGYSLPKHTVINFYSVAGRSEGTEVTVNEASETVSKNAVSISDVLPMNQTIPTFMEHMQPAASSLDLDEDYDD
ncbi:uncharacterized protein NC2alpha [Hetaerina americana]|uniref:uncharacterized protein NC2alpha n=1 Tax=Hetaerina americana TaxID=62018 RepID=UPI003A7F33C4